MRPRTPHADSISLWWKPLRPYLCALGAIAAIGAGAAAAYPVPVPGMTGPLTANADPASFEAGPLGDVYVTGAVTGLALWQDNPAVGDRDDQVDLSNGQVFIQTTSGLVQFYVQAGAYSLPDLGTPYFRSETATDEFYGTVPQAFVKLAPSEHFSVIAGKLPTLIGAEYTFSFENVNIERGLLWNQENAVNRGVQATYANGPLTVAVSWNDGFYSDEYTWIWGAVSYAIDSSNTISFVAGGNTDETYVSSLATPLFQNNQQIYNLIYTHVSGPLTLQGYLQYTDVPSLSLIGNNDASTLGGAVYATYAFNEEFKLSGRVEYIDSSGSVADGSPSLIYGPGSSAWSVTVTPTYQRGIFFARAEASYVGVEDETPGLALGATGTETSQARLLFETGFLF